MEGINQPLASTTVTAPSWLNSSTRPPAGYPTDADDIAFLLCAIHGQATHLVTYDTGFADLAPDCSFAICQPLDFLAALRSALAP